LAQRLDEIRAAAAGDRRLAASLTASPVVDDLGGPIGNDLRDAADLLDAILQRVAANLVTAENRQTGELRLRARVGDDLAVARRLSALLGSQVNRVAQLERRIADAGQHAPTLSAASRELTSVRTELEAEDRQRTGILDGLASAAARVDHLRKVEADVRELAARCREKVLQAPKLAVPSVDALGDPPAVDAAGIEPWAATRARVQPWLERMQRLDAAFALARERFQAALDERDQQRGLLQAFRGKAAAHGFGEHPDIEPLYRAAEDVLWSAPCDLVAAAPLVQRYLEAVNAKVAR
jgi:hypothetical protein